MKRTFLSLTILASLVTITVLAGQEPELDEFVYLPLIARHGPAPTPAPTAELIIASLQPTSGDETITIHNRGIAAQNMTGWAIQSYTPDGACEPVPDQRYTFPAGFTLAAGATVRVHSGPDAISNPPDDLLWTTSRIWNDRGDRADLLDDQGRLVGTVSYGECQP